MLLSSLDAFSQLHNQLYIDIRLEEGLAHLLEHLRDLFFIDNGRLAEFADRISNATA